MVRLLMAIYDTKAEVYFAPFVAPTLGACYRNLADEVNKKGDPSNMLASHPGDFELCECGSYDDETGYIEAHKAPKIICRLSDLVVVED
jgi:hypothetical protein